MTIPNFLSAIKNGQLQKKEAICFHSSKHLIRISSILLKYGLIQSFYQEAPSRTYKNLWVQLNSSGEFTHEGTPSTPCIQNLNILSSSGRSRFATHSELRNPNKKQKKFKYHISYKSVTGTRSGYILRSHHSRRAIYLFYLCEFLIFQNKVVLKIKPPKLEHLGRLKIASDSVSQFRLKRVDADPLHTPCCSVYVRRVLEDGYQKLHLAQGYKKPKLTLLCKHRVLFSKLLNKSQTILYQGTRSSGHSRLPSLSGNGIVLVSTTKGIMSDTQASSQNLGGKLICSIHT